MQTDSIDSDVGVSFHTADIRCVDGGVTRQREDAGELDLAVTIRYSCQCNKKCFH